MKKLQVSRYVLYRFASTLLHVLPRHRPRLSQPAHKHLPWSTEAKNRLTMIDMPVATCVLPPIHGMVPGSSGLDDECLAQAMHSTSWAAQLCAGQPVNTLPVHCSMPSRQ